MSNTILAVLAALMLSSGIAHADDLVSEYGQRICDHSAEWGPLPACSRSADDSPLS
jgi:hypothetical protein